MPIGQHEAGRAVIEDSRSPSGNRVARCAGRSRSREPCRDVVRYVPAKCSGALECRLVASITIRRTEGVVVVHMARNAGGWRRRHVCAGQGKPGCAVIERCRRPTHRRVTSGTVGCSKRRTGCGVHRIIRLLPGRQMAARIPAIGRRDRQIVVVIDVAGSAGHGGMAIGQQKPGRAVVECRRRPTDRRMARRAIRHGKGVGPPMDVWDSWFAARSSNGILSSRNRSAPPPSYSCY